MSRMSGRVVTNNTAWQYSQTQTLEAVVRSGTGLLQDDELKP